MSDVPLCWALQSASNRASQLLLFFLFSSLLLSSLELSDTKKFMSLKDGPASERFLLLIFSSLLLSIRVLAGPYA